MFSNFKPLLFTILYLYLTIEYLIHTVTYETFFGCFPQLENFYLGTLYPFFSHFRINLNIFLFIIILHILISFLLVVVNDICTSEDYQNNYAKYDENAHILYMYIFILLVTMLYFFKIISLKNFAFYILLLAFIF